MKRLGRGLGAILEDAEAGYLKDLPNRGVSEIDVLKIKSNPFQPRREFNEESINELAESIKKHGLIQPIIVIKDKKDDNYILVAGERRLKATKKLGKDKIKAIIVDYTVDDLREYALIENIQREDLSPIEIALSLYELIKKHGYTHDELAKNLGKSRAYITNMLRILNLPEEVIEKIRKKELSLGHAKVLVSLSNEKTKEIAEKILKENLSVRETEKLVKKIKENKKDDYLNEDIIKITEKLKENDIKVEIGKDFIKLKYKNDTDLEKLKKLLGINN
ncbi:ParB/RepB/Spo0J family partition protein [Caminibacter mediatlanticus]|uniref:Stage 0 sporulation protein j n=1 Tax=Caminibacter mediatlanticus TB-2 TaxID=391592 RepID=A0AAI9AIS2_9BACT|nr:ParB/RepB/Spo0J family partition protein [Caminibacter mediatlanticus]EDM24428.1 stage 0 sporulation protein j [Caminibacter mediatlanticus TB-2]